MVAILLCSFLVLLGSLKFPFYIFYFLLSKWSSGKSDLQLRQNEIRLQASEKAQKMNLAKVLEIAGASS